MTETHVLILNEMPRSSNRPAANRYAGGSDKKAWQGKFLAELMLARPKKGMSHVNASIVVRWKHKRHRDWHNYFAGIVKPLADALVTGGYLPDDTGEFFNIETPFTFEYPAEWPNGLHKVALLVKLDCTYPEEE